MKEITEEQIDIQSEKLMLEFFEHYNKFREANPEDTEMSIVFQSWSIQKIAGLQVMVLTLAKQIDRMLGVEE